MSEMRKLAVEANVEQQIEEKGFSRPITPTEMQEQEFVAELLSSTGFTKPTAGLGHEEPMITTKEDDYQMDDVIDEEKAHDAKKKKKKKSGKTSKMGTDKKKEKLTVRPNINTIIKSPQKKNSPTEKKNISKNTPNHNQAQMAKSLPADALSPRTTTKKNISPRKSFDIGSEKPNSPMFDSKLTPKSTDRSQKSTTSGNFPPSPSGSTSLRLSGMKMKKKWMTPSPNFISKTPRFCAAESERTPSPVQYNVSSSTFGDSKTDSHLGSSTFRSAEKRFYDKQNEDLERSPSPHTYDPLKSEESMRAHSGVIAGAIFKMSPRKDVKTTMDDTPSFIKYYPAKVEALDRLSPRVSSPIFSKETSPRFQIIKADRLGPALTKYSPEKALPGISVKDPDKNLSVFKSQSARLATYSTIEKNKTPDTALPIDFDYEEVLSMPSKK